MNKQTTILQCYDNDAYNSNLYITMCGTTTKKKTWEESSVKVNYVLWVVTDGTVKIVISNQEIVLNKGDAYLFFPQTAYKATCLTDSCSFIFTHFGYQIINNKNALDIYAVDGQFKYPTIKKEVNLFIGVIRQHAQGIPVSYLRLKGAFSILIAKFIELKGKRVASVGERAKPITKLLPALDYISQHSNENISVKMLANTVFLSEKYFCSLFKEAFGISPMKYITDIKLNAALECLHAKQSTIKDISASLGFADQFVFSKSFKRKFGISPSDIYKNKGEIETE